MALVARNLLRHGAEGRDTILLPSYLCHSMIQPFAELGLRVRFYALEPDLSASLAGIRGCIDDRTSAVLLMHYFGFGQPKELVEALVEQVPWVAVIDDRTHMHLSDLRTAHPLSGQAYTVYSPRKWGPFPDLGIVVWPQATTPNPTDPLFDGRYDLAWATWRLLGTMLRAFFFAWPVDFLRSGSLWPFRRAEAVLDRRTRVCRASPLSRWLWRRWDWEVAWRCRRQNYEYLLDNWPAEDIVPLYQALPESVCPLGFPVRTPDRDRARRHLVASDIYPPIHWQRPDEVPAADFPETAALAGEELTIPIDQRYGLQHMDYILENVGRL
jgi:hypothetical protein